MFQGSSWQFTLTWKDNANQLVNLTGYSAKMQIREGEESPVLMELNTSNGRILLGGASGFISLKLTATETGSFVSSDWANPHMYDLEVDDGTGKITKLIWGPLANNREITR